jgi:hypothetical protein
MADRHAEILKKLQDHLIIVDRIITGWKALGLLERYAAELLNWVLGFLIYDIRSQEPEDRAVLLREFRQILMRNLNEEDLLNAHLSSQTNALLKTIMTPSENENSPQISRMLMYRYYLEQHGLRRCLGRLVSGFFHIKPLSAFYRGLRHILPAPTKSMQHYLQKLEGTILSDHRATDALLLLITEYTLLLTTDNTKADIRFSPAQEIGPLLASSVAQTTQPPPSYELEK